MLHALLAAAVVAAAATTAPSGSPAAAIDVVASNWAFTPGIVTLHVGEPATFHFTSKQGVHGVISDGLGLQSTTLLPGKTMTVVLTPKKAGTYKITCSIPCGAGHVDMVLNVNVES